MEGFVKVGRNERARGSVRSKGQGTEYDRGQAVQQRVKEVLCPPIASLQLHSHLKNPLDARCGLKIETGLTYSGQCYKKVRARIHV